MVVLQSLVFLLRLILSLRSAEEVYAHRHFFDDGTRIETQSVQAGVHGILSLELPWVWSPSTGGVAKRYPSCPRYLSRSHWPFCIWSRSTASVDAIGGAVTVGLVIGTIAISTVTTRQGGDGTYSCTVDIILVDLLGGISRPPRGGQAEDCLDR